MLVQVYGDNAFKKQLFTSGVTGFLRVEKMWLMMRGQVGRQQAELLKTFWSSSNCLHWPLTDSERHSW
jgi:hypothetical protein